MPRAQIYTYADIMRNKHNELAKMSDNAPEAPAWNQRIFKNLPEMKIPMRPADDNNTGYVPSSKYLQTKLDQEVMSFADNSHRSKLQRTAGDFKKIMADHFPSYGVFLTGSFPAGVDLEGSDLDFCLDIPNPTEKFSSDLLREFSEKLQKLRRPRFVGDREPEMEFGKFKMIYARTPVLQLVHHETGVSVDVTCNNDAPKRNTQLLVYYGQLDPRFAVVCRAVKRWAGFTGVLGAKMGRLNSFSLCLLVLHFFIARVKIFPNLQEIFPELNGEFHVENDDYEKRNLKNEMTAKGLEPAGNKSVGAGVLFVAFLKYYAKFDFTTKWISIRQGKAIKKRRDVDENPLDGMPQSSYRMCIQDPFISKPYNCAGSVWYYGTFTHIRLQFRLSYQRILKERTIFTNGQISEWRKRIYVAGTQRDLQIVQWKKEIERVLMFEWTEKRLADIEAPYPSTPCFSYYQKPSYFWEDLREFNRSVTYTPWPVQYMLP